MDKYIEMEIEVLMKKVRDKTASDEELARLRQLTQINDDKGQGRQLKLLLTD